MNVFGEKAINILYAGAAGGPRKTDGYLVVNSRIQKLWTSGYAVEFFIGGESVMVETLLFPIYGQIT
jgi:hypothetical protein